MNNSLAESNWPLVNLRAQEAERAAQMFMRQKADIDQNEDLFFDAQTFNSANQQVANILSKDSSKITAASVDNTTESGKASQNTAVKEATLEDIEGAQWGDEDDMAIDIEMPEEVSSLPPTDKDGN